jgi:hypothetical protein
LPTAVEPWKVGIADDKIFLNLYWPVWKVKWI